MFSINIMRKCCELMDLANSKMLISWVNQQNVFYPIIMQSRHKKKSVILMCPWLCTPLLSWLSDLKNRAGCVYLIVIQTTLLLLPKANHTWDSECKCPSLMPSLALCITSAVVCSFALLALYSLSKFYIWDFIHYILCSVLLSCWQ